MAADNSQTQGVDLDSTSRLPILDVAAYEGEIEGDLDDEPVQLEYTPVVPSVKADFTRPAGVDLPSLAESVRSVEERIARQQAEYEALSRSYERALDGEAAAVARANAAGADLGSMRAMLEAEQARSREIDKALAERNAAVESARVRVEESLREAERGLSEARILRDTLAARDATIAQVLHSLGERDAQFIALQHDYSKLLPALEERTQAGAKLEAELRTTRERFTAMAAELKSAQHAVVALTTRLEAGENELADTRRELASVSARAATHLELLRSREWRRGFDQNLYRELDAKMGAAQDDRGALQSQRDQLGLRVAELESKLGARDEAIAKFQAAALDYEELQTRHEMKLLEVEEARTELMHKITALDGERSRLQAELALRDETIAELHAAAVDHEAVRVGHEVKLRHSEEARHELLRKVAALEDERSRLHGDLAGRDETIAKLNAAAVTDDAARAKHEFMLQQVERACADLTAQIAALEKDRSRLNSELALRDRAVADALSAARDEAQRSQDRLAAAHQEQASLATQIQGLQAALQGAERDKATLAAQLEDARLPLEPIQADVKRLTDELAAKTGSLEHVNEENRGLRAALERARGALEEREFLIRRLERSESNNANVLGRIQTSIERLGSPAGSPGNAAVPMECTAELVRVDGEHKTSHVLKRRTRIGRAADCEMQIDSSSVSRHHALLLMSTRDVIVEDLNSTNGVIVNGRKVSRHLLSDGDLLAVGEAQFRLSVKPVPRTLEPAAAEAH